MIHRADRAVGFARWWVGAYTRTAPDPDASDRRDEVASDLHEQRAAPGTGPAWSVTGRTLRGMPDDLAWRLSVERSPGRLRWHLAHPATVLGASLVLQLVFGTTWDAMRGRDSALGLVALALAPLLSLLWAGTIGFAVVALALARPDPRRALRLESWRRFAICTMSATYALAGPWRFVDGGWGAFTSLAWGVFGVALLLFLTLQAARVVRQLALVLDFRKIPS